MNEIKKIGEEIGYNYSAIMLAQFISMPLSIFYISILTRTLGPEKFGNLTIFIATAQLFFCIFTNWTKDSIIRFGSEVFTKEKDFGEVIGSQLIINFSSLLLALPLLFLLKDYLQEVLQLGGNSFLWVSIYLTVYIFSDLTIKFLQARHLLRSYAVALLSRHITLIIMLGLMLGVLKYLPSVPNIIIIESVSYLLIFGIFSTVAFSYRRFFLNVSYSRKKIIEILNYSWPVMIMVFLGYIMLWADTWMIKYFLTLKTVGEYEAANRLIQMILNIIMPLSIVGFPIMVSLRSIGSNSIINIFATKIVAQLCFLWSFIMLILIISSKGMIYLIFGEDFIPSVTVFQVLLIGVSFQILPVLYTTILQAYDRTKRMALIAAISVIVNIFLDVILIPRYGIAGAAISKACTLIVCAILYERSAIRCLQYKENNYVVYRFLSTPFLSLLIIYIFKMSVFTFIFIIFLYWSSIMIAKKNGIFSEEGLFFWEKIKMPLFVASAVKKFHGVIS